MKVKELIEKLSSVNPEAQVEISVNDPLDASDPIWYEIEDVEPVDREGEHCLIYTGRVTME